MKAMLRGSIIVAITTLEGMTAVACLEQTAQGVNSDWVLLVRPERRLIVDNATEDWRDYLSGRSNAAMGKERYQDAASCMAAGRNRFQGRARVDGSVASETLDGESIQCVRGCRVDSDAAVMICEEVTQPEIFR